MPRLFTALDLPDEIRAELYALHQPLPGARWIDPANYHITLRFVGDIDNARAHEFAANLTRIDIDAFELIISGLGIFGGNNPRSIWAGVEPNESLQALARAHEKAARATGLAIEKRPFKPHVTLARLNGTSPDAVAKFLTRYSGYRSEPFFVGEALLMSSKPSVGGGPYAIEEHLPLRGGLYMDEGEAAWD